MKKIRKVGTKFNHIYLRHGQIFDGCRRELSSTSSSSCETNHDQLKPYYDAIIVGAGHNGLVAAAYLGRAGLKVGVFERRHLVGGAAVTEEIIPGFKFSRASYVFSLFRPRIVEELQLKKYGLKFIPRDPNSYTPLLNAFTDNAGPRSLLLGRNMKLNQENLAKFSPNDAKNLPEYEDWLNKLVGAVEPLIDNNPLHLPSWCGQTASIKSKLANWKSLKTLLGAASSLDRDMASFYDLLTAPASKILDSWFESEPIKATLATDSVIGAMTSPYLPGSGYVLLHHVMGEVDGVKGAWAYVEGGMGSVSQALAKSATEHGVQIFTDKAVERVLTDGKGRVSGVLLKSGEEIGSRIVLSNATANVTYLGLVDKSDLPEEFLSQVKNIDYTSCVTKINVAVSRIPNFIADPNSRADEPMPHHHATIHLNSEQMSLIHDAYLDATNGCFSRRPVIEMTIPSSLDKTLAPAGAHVVQLFTQYTPYMLNTGEWTDEQRQKYADTVFDDIEKYAPGFKASIIGTDVLTPPDLEDIFGLTGGNIFHGAMSLDQLYFKRPTPDTSNYSSPLTGLYLCGSGAHPGGGVMGAPGRLAAMTAIQQYGR